MRLLVSVWNKTSLLRNPPRNPKEKYHTNQTSQPTTTTAWCARIFTHLLWPQLYMYLLNSNADVRLRFPSQTQFAHSRCARYQTADPYSGVLSGWNILRKQRGVTFYRPSIHICLLYGTRAAPQWFKCNDSRTRHVKIYSAHRMVLRCTNAELIGMDKCDRNYSELQRHPNQVECW